MKTKNLELNIFASSIFLALLCGILGYFGYGSADGTLGMFLLSICFGISLYIALIPLCGVIIQVILMQFLIIPEVLEFTNLEPSVLVTGIFGIYTALGFILTCTTSRYFLMSKK